MKLATFQHAGSTRVGYIENNQVIDLSGLLPDHAIDMLGLIRACSEDAGLIASLHARSNAAPHHALEDIRLCAPIPKPTKNIFCVGKNYYEHAHEFHKSGFDASAGKDAIPEYPIIFSKPPTTVIGPGDAIPGYLDPSESVDYENELAVIIGRGGRGITRAAAMGHVFGYTIVNDVTARTLQQRHKQWLLGKGIDGFCPMGPVILTADAISDVGALRLETRVNGELRQNAQVKDLIFDIPTLIEAISRSITLESGDIIATGTPAGVGIGFTPPRFLKKGDVVSASIDAIGVLTNPVE